jgi:hypothetical protein
VQIFDAEKVRTKSFLFPPKQQMQRAVACMLACWACFLKLFGLKQLLRLPAYSHASGIIYLLAQEISRAFRQYSFARELKLYS